MSELSDDAWRLQCFIEGTRAGTWEWNVQTGKVILNEMWAQMLGYTLEELSPVSIETWENCTHPDDLRKAQEMLKRHFSGELPYYEIELRMKHKDGHWVWIIDRGRVATRTDEGDPLIMFGTHTDISERKKMEEALRESEERQKVMISNISDVIGILGIDGTIKYKSPNIEKWFGWKPEELVGTDGWLAVHPDDLQRIRAAFLELIESDISEKKVEYRYKCRDGSYKWIELTGVDLTDNPLINGILMNYHDITERKESEENLRRQMSFFEQMFSQSSVSTQILDKDGWCERINPKLSEIFGVAPEYLEGGVYNIFKDESLKKEGILPLLRTVFDEGKTVEWEINFDKALSADAQNIKVEERNKVWFHNWAYPILDENGELSHVIIQHTNISQRKEMELSLLAERERLSVTLRSIGDGVITTDTNGRVMIMNKVAEELCGWDQEEARGKLLTEVFRIIGEESRFRQQNPVERVLKTGASIELASHSRLISRDGTERIIADSGAPIRDNESRIIGVVLVFRDITEKQKLVESLQRIDKLDSLGVLAGGIAHDFNNLLGGIFGYISLARESCVEEESNHHLDKALSVLDRAKDLTLQLLTFSKGGVPKRKTGNLGELVKKNTEFVLSGSNVICDFRVSPDLRLCDFDENQIGQVFDNILINAKQAMPDGGRVTVSIDNILVGENEFPNLNPGDYIKISITDTGTGIPKHLHKRIFDPFFTTKDMGNGLGLATCYSIVQNHDGYIDVESVQGQGSTFHIYLPASAAQGINRKVQSADTHFGMGRILVLDDEDFIREVVGKMISTMGYEMIGAKTGEEALQICRDTQQQGIPLICALFDLTIPGAMGGREAVKELRKELPDLPVFASSGFSEDPIMARPVEFGFTDSIRKPFRKNDLARMLNRHIR